MTIQPTLAQYKLLLAVIAENAAMVAEAKYLNGKAGQPLVSLPKKGAVHGLLQKELGGATNVAEYLAGNPDIARLKFEPPVELAAARQQTAHIEEEIVLFDKARFISFLEQPSIALDAWEVLELDVPSFTLADGRLITVITVVGDRTFSGTDIPVLQHAVRDWPLETAFRAIVQTWQIDQVRAPLFNALQDPLSIERQKYLYGCETDECFAYRAPVLAMVMVPEPTTQTSAPALAVIGRWFRRETDAEKCLAETRPEVARLLALRQRGDRGLLLVLQATEKTTELHLRLVMLCCPDHQLTAQERFQVEELVSLCPTASIDLALLTYWNESAEKLLEDINGKAPAEPWNAAKGDSLCQQTCSTFAALLTVDPEDEPEFEQTYSDCLAVLHHLYHKDFAQARAKLSAARRSEVMMYHSPTAAERFAAQLARAMGVNN